MTSDIPREVTVVVEEWGVRQAAVSRHQDITPLSREVASAMVKRDPTLSLIRQVKTITSTGWTVIPNP